MTAKKTASAERPTLAVKPRELIGTRRVTRLRKEGLIPGVVYGKKSAPTAIVVSQRELVRFLHARAGEHGLVTLRVEADGKPIEKPVLIKKVEHDPVRGDIVHVEFHAIALTEQIRVKIPLVLQGTPIGVKQENGVLEHFLREIEVECLPAAIPKNITYDVSALKIGDTIHVKELTTPAGAKITLDPEAPVASVFAPKEEKLEEVAPAVTEPEVLREKKPEAEEAAASAAGKAEGKKEDAKDAKKDAKKEEKK